jgi:hypothetical protein
MTIYKNHARLIALISSLTFSGYVIAGDSAPNENKHKRASNTFSDVDNINLVGSDAHPAQNKLDTEYISTPGPKGEGLSAEEKYHQQREALRQYLENRHRQMYMTPDESVDAESRRNQLINDIEQRRELMDKMYEYRRRAIEERRQKRLLEIHRTGLDTPSVIYSS